MPIVAFNPHDTVILFGYGLYAGKPYSVTASIFLFAGHHMSIERNRILLNRIDHFQKNHFLRLHPDGNPDPLFFIGQLPAGFYGIFQLV